MIKIEYSPKIIIKIEYCPKNKLTMVYINGNN